MIFKRVSNNYHVKLLTYRWAEMAQVRAQFYFIFYFFNLIH